MAMNMQRCFARACHDFLGTENGDLAFTTGEVLFIDRQIDGNWCHGQSLSTGRSGMFPSNFVTRLNLPSTFSSGHQKLFLALNRFIGQEQGDLSFLEGDIILGIRRIDDNWWEGEAGGRRGIFPMTFVVELSPPNLPLGQSGQSIRPTKEISPPSKPVSSNNEMKAKVKHDLKPVDPEELELKSGDVVIIEEFIDKFTCRGRTLDGRRGLFGKAFVEFLDSGPISTSSASIRGSVSSQCQFPPARDRSSVVLPAKTAMAPLDNFAVTTVAPIQQTFIKPQQSPAIPSPVASDSVMPYGRTKYKFEAEYPGELPFPAGVIVQLIRHVDDEWTEGILDGRRGILPTSYVDVVVDCPRMQLSSPKSTGQFTGQKENQQHSTASNVKTITGDSGYTSSGSEPGSKERTTWTVKYDFMGSELEDLTAFKGDPVVFLKEINDEWVEARHVITGQTGVIPKSYIESPEPEVKWRHQKPAGRSNEPSTTSVFLDETIAQNIRRLGGTDSVTISKSEQTRWSPSPASFVQNVAAARSSISHSISPDAAPTVQFRSSNGSFPTVPQLKQSTTKQQQSQVQFQPQSQPHQQQASTMETKRSTPPPRPAVPAALKMRQETASQHLEMQRQRAKEQKKKDMRVQRNKVIQEILVTEREYAKDLTLFRDVVLSKRNMLDSNALLGGSIWEDAVQLSSKLLDILEQECGKDFVYQEIGSAFLDLSDGFTAVYGAFCQSHVESQALLEKYEVEPQKQAVLKDMLTKVQHGTGCIDLSTMLSRPVQRVLKYPLFLGELLKVTEDNQSDKVKLMMALKVMTEVAQNMNESKRRKDLVTKYRGDGDITFSERLSRFNLHSMRKKSTRLSMRLSSTIGLTQLAKDDQFADADRQFRTIDRCCKNVLRDVQAYCEQVVLLYNHRMSMADSLHCGVLGGAVTDATISPRNIHRKSSSISQRPSSVSDSTIDPMASQLSMRYLELWSKVLLSECILQKFFDAVNAKVRQPLAHVQHSCKGPEKLISKRGDKLLDYESATAKLEKHDGGAGTDFTKAAALEELRKAKAEYEAMNTQLLSELPQFNSLANEIMTMAIRAFIGAQRTFVYELGHCFEQTIGPVAPANTLEKFQRKHRQATESMANLCFIGDAGSSGSAKSSGTGTVVIKRQSPTSNISSGTSTWEETQKARPTITFPHKLQTENERAVLRNQYGQANLYMVTAGYEARSDLELTLKEGDVVGVIVDKDPMGNADRWFVDSAVSKGFVPQHVLKPMATEQPKYQMISAGGRPALELIDLTEAAERRKRDRAMKSDRNVREEIQMDQPAAPIAPPKQQRSQSVVNTVRGESPLIFLQHDRQPSSCQSSGHATLLRRPLRHTMVARTDDTTAAVTKQSAQPMDTPVYTTVDRRIPRRPAPAPPTVTQTTADAKEIVNLQPIRPAPRPPPPAGAQAENCERKEREGTGERNVDNEQVEFYVAMYNFVANSENELCLSEGQVVAVHDKQDLECNPEWWLVEDEDGALGYAPGNYFTPLPRKD